MGRRSHSRALSLWVNGVHLGQWILRPGGEMELRYAQTWLEDPRSRPLSLSLPLNFHGLPLKGERVANYFDNLLPDSDAIRRRAAERFKTGSTAPFDLLRAIGRDCVGALQILGEDEEPQGFDRIEGVALTEADVARHLTETIRPNAFGQARDPDNDFRISLAGAQEKTAFLRWNGQWLAPRGATPTTHIFKLPLGLVGNRRADLSTSVDNEWLCLKLLKAYGVPAANAEILTFEDQRILSVERFDRRLSSDGTWIMRLMQEDFCQVTGCPPLRKYESDGGPGLQAIADTLHQSRNAQQDLETLMLSQILFWMLRAPDGHAKNFSIELLAGGHYRLTPLYDVMSALPVLGPGPNQWSEHRLKLAMALLGKSRHYAVSRIQRRHFNSTALKLGMGTDAERLIERIVEQTPAIIAKVRAELPTGFSPHVSEAVIGGLSRAADQLAKISPQIG